MKVFNGLRKWSQELAEGSPETSKTHDSDSKVSQKQLQIGAAFMSASSRFWKQVFKF